MAKCEGDSFLQRTENICFKFDDNSVYEWSADRSSLAYCLDLPL